MSQLIKINNQNLKIKEFNGQKVLTFKDIDMLHERANGTTRRNFYENKFNFDGSERIIENVDYFKIKLTEYEIRIQFAAGRNASELILITESGYMMLVKSLNDDLAWKVQRQLINNYFRAKETGISLLHAEVNGLVSRVDNLEKSMTVDYCQQLILQDAAKAAAINAMGGKDKPSYRNSSIRGRVFSQMWKDYKEYFEVNSYKNTARVEIDRAKDYLKNWRAQGKTLREIERINKKLNKSGGKYDH